MESALHQYRRAAQIEGLLDLVEDLLLGQQIAAVGSRRSVEGAEIAPGKAAVGVVDVPVDDEGDHVSRHLPRASLGGELPHGKEVTGTQQLQRLDDGESDAFA